MTSRSTGLSRLPHSRHFLQSQSVTSSPNPNSNSDHESISNSNVPSDANDRNRSIQSPAHLIQSPAHSAESPAFHSDALARQAIAMPLPHSQPSSQQSPNPQDFEYPQPSTIINSVPQFPILSPSKLVLPQRPHPHPHAHPHSQPMSPPKTRSPSAEQSTANLLEDWRAYADKVRSQADSEREHMVADRERMREVMAAERDLWTKEREILLARIADLEQRASVTSNPMPVPIPVSQKPSPYRASSQRSSPYAAPQRPTPSYFTLPERTQVPSSSFRSPLSNPPSSGSVDGGHKMIRQSSLDSYLKTVRQESGRDALGRPFYAPAPRNPSRTFDGTSATRVDSMSTGLDLIRVTSKELTPNDFGLQEQQLAPVPESPGETVDISHISPELEGVAIKATALCTSFTAKIFSPQDDSPETPKGTSPPTANPSNLLPLSPMGSGEKKETADIATVIRQPEYARRIINAGHTPNHSISKFDLMKPLDSESDCVTPTQTQMEVSGQLHSDINNRFGGQGHDMDGSWRFPREASDGSEPQIGYGDLNEEEEAVLSEPLTLPPDGLTKIDNFLVRLVEKLSMVEQSESHGPYSPSETSIAEPDVGEGSEVDEDFDEMGILASFLGSEALGFKGKDREEEDEDDGEVEENPPPLKLKPSMNFGRPMGRM